MKCLGPDECHVPKLESQQSKFQGNTAYLKHAVAKLLAAHSGVRRQHYTNQTQFLAAHPEKAASLYLRELADTGNEPTLMCFGG